MPRFFWNAGVRRCDGGRRRSLRSIALVGRCEKTRRVGSGLENGLLLVAVSSGRRVIKEGELTYGKDFIREAPSASCSWPTCRRKNGFGKDKSVISEIESLATAKQ